MQDYEALLKRAQTKIARAAEGERFQMPVADVAVQGNNTIIANFTDIAKTFRREPQHLFKVLLRELAVPGELKGTRASFQGKFSKEQIARKLEGYAKEFVMCAACGKPDTNINREDGLLKMKCEVCATKRVVKDVTA